MSARRAFASDNWSGVHPEVLERIAAVNSGHAPAYGADEVTARATGLFREHFGAHVEVFFTFNGTGANVTGLQALLAPYEHVVCAESAHVNTDECGAPERFLGSKVVDVPTSDGKLTPELVESVARGWGDPHHSQPRVVSVTQSTEIGTRYAVEEVAALADWAHGHAMYLHMDGARLANAAAGLGVGLGATSGGAGVDVLSFGGTKNGLLGGEAVVLFRPELASSFPFVRKQAMQLASKMRFTAAQFEALLSGDLWLRNASHANAMARRLEHAVRDLPGVRVTRPVEANAVFALLAPEAAAALQEQYAFYVWDERTGEVRWMTSFDTEPEDVDGFAAAIRRVVA
ncbi:MAG: low specificity L-threonine aldolase [Actinomycetota bacterium]|nr:low specificity L-threonine aldolase [Actinomycetota bacterium]